MTEKEMKPMIYNPKRIKEILYEGDYNGYHFVIVSYGTHPCAYVEIPKDNKLYKIDYSDESLWDISVHGGFTFGDDLLHLGFEENRYFLGWDYAHCGDYAGYDILFSFSGDDKKWSTEEIYEEVKSVIDQLINFVKEK